MARSARKFAADVSLMLTLFFLSHAPAQEPTPRSVDPFGPPTSPPPASRAPRASAAASDNRSPVSARQRCENELSKITELEVVEMPLKDVMIYLQEKHGIPILLNAKKLEEASVSPDSPITKSLRGISLAAALDLMLKDLELDYYVGEVLVITTPHDAAAQTEIRTYDCRSLLRADATNESAHRAARLIEMIRTTIDPDTWRGVEAGYPGMISPASRRQLPPSPWGAITEFDGLLIVTQTAKTHTRLQQVLNMLADAARLDPILGKTVR